jgi:polyhydroxybutyrate depolymerase
MRRRTALQLLAAGMASGLGSGAAAGEAETRTLEVEGRRAWLAAAAGGGDRRPLVIGLHGGAGNAPGYIDNSQLLAKAPAAGFVAVCPEGTPIPFPTPGDHRVWNSGPEYERASGGADDVAFVRRLIEAVGAERPLDPDRIFVTGFSNGAQMAYRLALGLSDRVAAIAPMSGGRLAQGLRPSRPVPVLHVHGTADSVYPPAGGLGAHSIGRTPHAPIDQVIGEWVGFDHAAPTPRVEAGAGWTHQVHEGPDPVELVLVEGLGHQIAGGRDDRLPDQPLKSAPDAIALALAFFAAHPRR